MHGLNCFLNPLILFVSCGCASFLAWWCWKNRRLLSVIKRSRDSFKALVDLSPYGVALTTKDGIIVSANKALAQLLNRDIRALVGTSLPELLGLDSNRIKKEHADLKPGEILKLPAIHIKGRQGRVHHLRPCLFYHKTHEDLLFWQIQDQTTYFELEKRFEELVQSVPVGLFWADINGKIGAVNPGFKEIFPKDKSPSTLKELLGEKGWDEVSKMVRSKGHVFKTQIQLKEDDKTRFIKVEIKHCSHGTSNCLAGILKDETVEYELQKRLEAAYQKAEAASRAKSTFLSQMSHEFRTPLNVIMGMATLLEDKIVDKEALELVTDLKKASEHLTSLIGDILDLAKIESGKLSLDVRPFDLVDLMEDLANVLEVQARLKDLDFRLIIPEDIHRFYLGDPVRIRQIIFNLAGNAIKLTKKGWIEIQVSCHKLEQKMKRLEIRVTDTGPGIPKDILSELFKPFVQADEGRKAGGTGLGLSIARELVELMNGSIEVESEVGKGTTFKVTIELESVDACLLPENKTFAFSEFEPGTVLIADDVAMNRKILKAFLEKKGWKILEASNGKEVLEILEREGKVDLVLMDVSMPEMDGVEAAKHIRHNEKWKTIPVIAVTAHAMAEDRKKFLDAGMDGYVSKPIRPELLFEEIGKVLSERNSTSGEDEKSLKSKDEQQVLADEPEQSCKERGQDQSAHDVPIDYEALVNTCQGMEDLAIELLIALLKECPKWIEEAEQAVKDKDPKEIRKICHLIRGSASTVHAYQLNDAAEKLGKAAREGKEELYDELLENLKKASLQLQTWVRANICIPKALDTLEDIAMTASNSQELKMQA